MTRKVLMIGWHPSVVDYAKWPGLTAEKLRSGIEADIGKLKAQGYDATVGFIHSGETATDQIAETLQAESYDVVLIGAGVRKDDDHFLIFERLVNVVHEYAPTARIAFNTGPMDSGDAVRRWA